MVLKRDSWAWHGAGDFNAVDFLAHKFLVLFFHFVTEF